LFLRDGIWLRPRAVTGEGMAVKGIPLIIAPTQSDCFENLSKADSFEHRRRGQSVAVEIVLASEASKGA
jgi:hypothetical protein